MIIGTKIWTEKPQIEKRLTDLSEHMENVFQAYLRNEFETIEEYNEQAGEVAEPYQFLIVANSRRTFPIRRPSGSSSIAPADRDAASTPSSASTRSSPCRTTSTWPTRSVATDARMAAGPLSPHDPNWPRTREDDPAAACSRIHGNREIGRHPIEGLRAGSKSPSTASAANGELWRQDSRTGLDVPLGRAGATKLQHLKLGRGTSQHVMIAGKTGSGKSSLLHTLIVNLALHYSPDEVQFYLVDFKKGVEFKTYASHAIAPRADHRHRERP